MIPEDKFIERLVAGVCANAMENSKVVWNYEIEGRQFDVAVFFNNGPYEYLTLTEVKAHKSPISVGDVEAFVTKASDKGANKIAVFSAKGFQSGCIDVAKKHAVQLFRIYIADSPPTPSEFEAHLKKTGFTYGVSAAGHFFFVPSGLEPKITSITPNRITYAALFM